MFSHHAGSVLGAMDSVNEQPAWAAGSLTGSLDVDVRWIGDVVQSSPTQRSVRVSDDPPGLVLGMSDWLQVGGVNAPWSSAEMVELETRQDRTNMLQVEGTVGNGRSVFGSTENSVPLLIRGPTPDPASRPFPLVSSPVVKQRRRIIGGSMLHESLIMLHTETSTEATMAGRLSGGARGRERHG